MLKRDLKAICEKLNLCVDNLEFEKLGRYADLVLKWNKIVNLTSSKNISEFTLRHVVDGLAVVPHLRAEKKVMDVGSGCGIPGVVLSIMCPSKPVVLLEPRVRRARFLEQARIELGLSKVEVVRSKLEDVGLRFPLSGFTLVTRAFGQMARFGNLVQPFIKGVPRVYFLKSEAKKSEIEHAERIMGPCRTIELSVPGYFKRSLILFDNVSAR